MELDADIGRVMDAIRAEAPDTIVIVTADNGAWLDAYPDAGTTPFRGEKGTAFEGGWRVPGILWWPGHVQAGAQYHEMMSHIDAVGDAGRRWSASRRRRTTGSATTARAIYFDSIDNSAYVLGKAPHSARTSWVYIDGETFQGVRADISGDPKEPWLNIAWKYLYTAKDSWLGPEAESRLDRRPVQSHHGPLREIRHDLQRRSADAGADHLSRTVCRPGQRLGLASLIGDCDARLRPVDHEVSEHQAVPGGASTDLVPGPSASRQSLASSEGSCRCRRPSAEAADSRQARELEGAPRGALSFELTE